MTLFKRIVILINSIFIFILGIIKEEELERIDQIVKEDGWAQDDEIDYNQKLAFSDDDSDSPPPVTKESRNKEIKRVNFNDRNKELRETHRKDDYNRDREQQQQLRELEREKMDRDHNERNEREKMIDTNRQNGHRSGAPIVDAELLERVKQRKEEEEKRANERRIAAHKKLQELEQKIGKKKDLHSENENENPNSTSSGYGKVESIDSRNKTNDRYMNRDDNKPRDGKPDVRDFGNRYESKYERESRGGGASNPNEFFNKPFQANLPPRFQKQRDQQERHSSYKGVETQHRNLPRGDHLRRPNQSLPQNYITKGNTTRRDIPRRDAPSVSSEGIVEIISFF